MVCWYHAVRFSGMCWRVVVATARTGNCLNCDFCDLCDCCDSEDFLFGWFLQLIVQKWPQRGRMFVETDNQSTHDLSEVEHSPSVRLFQLNVNKYLCSVLLNTTTDTSLLPTATTIYYISAIWESFTVLVVGCWYHAVRFSGMCCPSCWSNRSDG